ncbi:MAG: tRNA (guanosine(46)-N7)-methyltransferase TrmB [Pseudomonadota bacterium]
MTERDQDAPYQRQIRSFVRREGRLTPAQSRAIETQWPRYGLDYDGQPIDFDAVFGRSAPRVLEIGIGNGDALVHMSGNDLDRDYVGIEVHTPGIGHALRGLGEQGNDNARLMHHDAMDVLTHSLAEGGLAQVNLYFPDPWPKKRHHKRRIVQKPFLDLVVRALGPGGVLHMATDWEPYAQWMLDELLADERFRNLAPGTDLSTGAIERPDERPLTRFEKRGHRHGHDVWDFKFARRK